MQIKVTNTLILLNGCRKIVANKVLKLSIEEVRYLHLSMSQQALKSLH